MCHLSHLKIFMAPQRKEMDFAFMLTNSFLFLWGEHTLLVDFANLCKGTNKKLVKFRKKS